MLRDAATYGSISSLLVKCEDEIRRSRPLQGPARTGLPFDRPASPQEGCENTTRACRRPPAHIVSNTAAISSGSGSPCSNRSAMTRNARAFTRSRASPKVVTTGTWNLRDPAAVVLALAFDPQHRWVPTAFKNYAIGYSQINGVAPVFTYRRSGCAQPPQGVGERRECLPRGVAAAHLDHQQGTDQADIDLHELGRPLRVVGEVRRTFGGEAFGKLLERCGANGRPRPRFPRGHAPQAFAGRAWYSAAASFPMHPRRSQAAALPRRRRPRQQGAAPPAASLAFESAGGARTSWLLLQIAARLSSHGKTCRKIESNVETQIIRRDRQL